MTMFKRIGGRKFLFAIILLTIGICVDIFTSRGLSANFKELMIYLMALFAAGNGAEHAAIAIKNRATSSKELEQTLKDVLKYQDAILSSSQLTNQAMSQVLAPVNKSPSPGQKNTR